MWRRFGVAIVVLAVSVATVVADSADAAAADQGPQIAFTANRNSDVYVVAATGGVTVNLTNHPAWDGSPSWSSDGSRIAFISDRDGNPDIWVMDADGSKPVNLTASLEHESDPVWSPDGSRIAYSASLRVEQPDGSSVWVPAPSIFVMDVATGATIRLSIPDLESPSGPDWARDAEDAQPTWSPDGDLIAFVRHYSGPTPTAQTSHIYTIRADGGGQGTFLAAGGWKVRGLDWSPDGSSIVWSNMNPHHMGARLVRWDVAKGEKHDIDVPLDLTDYQWPAWSSDGSTLAFIAYGCLPVGCQPGQHNSPTVYVWQPDGTEPPRLLTSASWDSNLAWQPWYPPVGLVDTTTGRWALREDAAETRFYYGNPDDLPFVGDWDCDGTETPGLYRQSDGYVYLRNTNTQGNADIRFFFGNPGDLPLAGDFNADGCDTVSIYRPSEQRFYIINNIAKDESGLGGAEYSFLFGNPGDKPVVGDWDGDGIDEVGLHRESTGLFYYRNTLTTGAADGQFYFGDPGDRFIAGDWGGVEGQDTPGLFRPSNTTFYFRDTLTEGSADSQLTWAGAGTGWLPIAGALGLR